MSGEAAKDILLSCGEAIYNSLGNLESKMNEVLYLMSTVYCLYTP